MTIDERSNALLEALLRLTPIFKGRIWNRIPGKERVYVDLAKKDGDVGHNAGVGHTIYVDVHTGWTCYDKNREWAGPRTKAYHARHKTMEQVREVIDRFVPTGDTVTDTLRRGAGSLIG